jgi:hypothetical protein
MLLKYCHLLRQCNYRVNEREVHTRLDGCHIVNNTILILKKRVSFIYHPIR